ncbi:helix-turn-helix domain-containing protein [Pseudomonas farris]
MIFVERAIIPVTDGSRTDQPHPPSLLSRREREIALHIACGRTSKEIAQRLSLSDLTVRKHRENLYRKLGIGSIPQLVRYCLEQHLVRPSTS